MGFGSIFLKTAALGLAVAVPAAVLAYIFGGLSVFYGVTAGFLLALANFSATLVTILGVSGERPASSVILVLFSFPTRLLLVGLALVLIAKTGAINTYATTVTLVVVYTMFAFSEFRFTSLKRQSQSV